MLLIRTADLRDDARLHPHHSLSLILVITFVLVTA